MDILDLIDAGEVDSEDSEDEVEDAEDLPARHGITKETLEANYQMLGSPSPHEKSSIVLSELKVKYPQVNCITSAASIVQTFSSQLVFRLFLRIPRLHCPLFWKSLLCPSNLPISRKLNYIIAFWIMQTQLITRV